MKRPRTPVVRAPGRIALAALFLAFLTPAAGPPGAASACTLWAAAGAAAQGGGALVAKNRDERPDHRQELAVLRPAAGYAALVLRAVGGASPGIKAGMNERGLVIVSATAGQVPADLRRRPAHEPGLMGRLLSRCAGVDEVLGEIDRLTRPVFYLLGDRGGIAAVEVAPDGRRAVERVSSGTLHHTNHYRLLAPEGDSLRPAAAGSLAREARIAAFLAAGSPPWSLEDFRRLSEDRGAGPDHSLWRTGRNPAAVRTLATWIARIPPRGDPELIVRLADPGRPERLCRLVLGEALNPGGVAGGGPCPEAP